MDPSPARTVRVIQITAADLRRYSKPVQAIADQIAALPPATIADVAALLGLNTED